MEAKRLAESPHRAFGQAYSRPERADLAMLVISAGIAVLTMFLLWEVVELGLPPLDQLSYPMHYARGISSSLVAALVVAFVSSRQHRQRRETLESEVQARTWRRTATHGRGRGLRPGEPAGLRSRHRGRLRGPAGVR